MKKTTKYKWKGSFNYHGQDFINWRYAKTEDGAFAIFCRLIAAEVGVSFHYIFNYFSANNKDNYRVERV